MAWEIMEHEITCPRCGNPDALAEFPDRSGPGRRIYYPDAVMVSVHCACEPEPFPHEIERDRESDDDGYDPRQDEYLNEVAYTEAMAGFGRHGETF